MSDTIDRLVRMLDEERESARKAREDRSLADHATMTARAELSLAKQEIANGESDLEVAEKKIAEWESFGKKNCHRKGLTLMPAKYYRSDIPF
jgi:predicted  nucleic acid-binding Zn-ribbon protein